MFDKKIHCKLGDAKENKMKFRFVIRMVNEKFYKPYEDFTISLKTKLHYEYSLKEMTRGAYGHYIKDSIRYFVTY